MNPVKPALMHACSARRLRSSDSTLVASPMRGQWGRRPLLLEWEAYRAHRNLTAGRRRDGHLNIRTLHRFILKGVRGRRLWAVKSTSGWVTTLRAWREFLQHMDTALRQPEPPAGRDTISPRSQMAPTPGSRAKHLAAIDDDLRRRGL